MNIVFGVIIGLLVLTTLVLLHELGHFIAARRNGVKVNEFGIGFPPRAIAWVKDPKTKKWHRLQKSEWDKPQKSLILSINWLPIGGFCAMDGESDADTRPHTFGAATFWQKTKILFAGVAMNWLVAFVILTILAFTGMPKFIDNQFFVASDLSHDAHPVTVQSVLENSPAAKAGIKEGDQITYAIDPSTNINNATAIEAATDLTAFNQTHAGQTVEYVIHRADLAPEERQPDVDDPNTLVLKVQLNDTNADYLLGVSMSQSGQTLYRSTWSAPLVGAVTTVQLTGETYRGLWTMVKNLCTGLASQLSSNDATREAGRQQIGQVGDSVSGPVGIIGVLFPAYAETGPTNLAFLAAVISISLACMNVLPIPALDGGRWLLIAIFKLRKKPLTTEVENKIVSRAFIFLIGLIILITVLDVTRLFR